MTTGQGVDEPPSYWVKPKEADACVVVLHEVWGLVPHVRDVCKRLGKLGFAAVAPDLYWRKKALLSPENIQKAMEGVWDLSLEERRDRSKVLGQMAKKRFGNETFGLVRLMYSREFRDALLSDSIKAVRAALSEFDRVAVLGFCLGGGLALKAAAREEKLRSAVSFYGEPPSGPEIRKLVGPVLSVHAEHDDLINVKVPAFVGEALSSGKDLTLKVYPRTRHGFFNDTNTSVYSEGPAEDAWELTKWFLGRTL